MWRYGHVTHVRCAKRSCPSCGALWAEDTRIRALAASQELRGAVALVTVTGPGVGQLPWDSTGRRVHPLHAREWNRQAPAKWSALHKAAAASARRAGGPAWDGWRLLLKAWEYQRRGILHLHLVVPCGGPRERQASEAYVRALAALAPTYRFGYVDRGRLPESGRRQSARRLEPVPPGRASAYVAGYVASSGAGKGGVAEVATAQGVPGAVLYVAQGLTRASGVTMRSLRLRRAVTTLWRGAQEGEASWRAARVCHAMIRGGPPMAPDLRGALLRRALSEGWTHGVHWSTGEVVGPVDAARPPALGAAPAGATWVDRVGAARLDLVLHGGHDGPRWDWSVRDFGETEAH